MSFRKVFYTSKKWRILVSISKSKLNIYGIIFYFLLTAIISIIYSVTIYSTKEKKHIFFPSNSLDLYSFWKFVGLEELYFRRFIWKYFMFFNVMRKRIKYYFSSITLSFQIQSYRSITPCSYDSPECHISCLIETTCYHFSCISYLLFIHIVIIWSITHSYYYKKYSNSYHEFYEGKCFFTQKITINNKVFSLRNL